MKCIIYLILAFVVLSTFILSNVKNNTTVKVAFDTFFAHDKLIHAIGSQVLFLLFYALTKSDKYSIGLVATVGIVVEITQHFSGRGFCFYDFLACLAGCLPFLLFKFILEN